MNRQQALEGVASVLRNRASESWELDRNAPPSELAELIASAASLEPETASALAWGEPVHLQGQEFDALCGAFSLNRDVLSLLVSPASEEMVLHALRDIGADLNSEECGICYELEGHVLNCSDMDAEALTSLIIDLLDHLVSLDEEGERLRDDNRTREVRLDALISTFAQLDDDQQLRVLAFACHEMAGVTVDVTGNAIRAYSTLRHRLFSDLTNQVLDHLAISNVEMSGAQLASAVGLSDARSLSQLRRNIDSALAELDSDLAVDSSPLIIRRRGRQRTYSIAAEARGPWLQVKRATGLDQEEDLPLAPSMVVDDAPWTWSS